MLEKLWQILPLLHNYSSQNNDLDLREKIESIDEAVSKLLLIADEQSIGSSAKIIKYCEVLVKEIDVLMQHNNIIDLLKSILDTNTDIQNYHLYAAIAERVMSLIQDFRSPSSYIATLASYKVIYKAEHLQASKKAQFYNKAEEKKKRKILSSDDYIKRELSFGTNTVKNRNMTRNWFLKAWLFLYTSSFVEGKEENQTQVLYELKSKFKELDEMSDSALKNLLTKLKTENFCSKMQFEIAKKADGST